MKGRILPGRAMFGVASYGHMELALVVHVPVQVTQQGNLCRVVNQFCIDPPGNFDEWFFRVAAVRVRALPDLIQRLFIGAGEDASPGVGSRGKSGSGGVAAVSIGASG